jgi:hypothetical protein
MASTYSPLKVELIGTGEQAGTWGTTTNTNLGTALEEAITGRATATFPSDANYTLPYINSNSAQVFRNLVLDVTSSGNLGATRDLIIPAIEKQYFIENNTSGGQSIRVKTAAGTGVTIPNGKIANVYCNGTNTRFADDFVAITGGTITGAALSNVSLSLSSPLPVTSGGTGLSTATQGDIIYASASNTYVALPKNTTATRYLANTGTSNNPAWAQIDLTNGVTGDLPLANLAQGTALSVLGVTGNATADNASIVAASDHQVLRRSGTSVAFGAVSLNQTNAVTGTLPVANGGTGAASLTANNVLLGNGTSALQAVAPGTSGNVLTSNGTTWVSTAIPTAFVTGMIMMWSGTIATIPSGWALCNGANGTPDLRDRFIIGASQDGSGQARTNVTGSLTQTGGSKNAIVVSHSHTGNTSTVSDHSHGTGTGGNFLTGSGPTGTTGWSGGGNYTPIAPTTTTAPAGSHSHTIATTTVGSSGIDANLPPYYALAFIMKT